MVRHAIVRELIYSGYRGRTCIDSLSLSLSLSLSRHTHTHTQPLPTQYAHVYI